MQPHLILHLVLERTPAKQGAQSVAEAIDHARECLHVSTRLSSGEKFQVDWLPEGKLRTKCPCSIRWALACMSAMNKHTHTIAAVLLISFATALSAQTP